MTKLSLAKTFGGKGMLCKWILSEFPKNYEQLEYHEGYLGGGSPFLNKKQSTIERINDKDYTTYCMWKEAKSGGLEIGLTGVQYSETTFLDYRDRLRGIVGILSYNAGATEFVLRNMSRSGMKLHFSRSDRLRGGINEGENLWKNKIANLPKIKARLKDTEIYNMDGVDFLRKFNTINSLAYLDPPYLADTRISKRVYAHEMTEKNHEDLLDFLLHEYLGLVILSAYRHKMYDDKLKSWNMIEKQVANHSGQNKIKNKRTEVLYKNF